MGQSCLAARSGASVVLASTVRSRERDLSHDLVVHADADADEVVDARVQVSRPEGAVAVPGIEPDRQTCDGPSSARPAIEPPVDPGSLTVPDQPPFLIVPRPVLRERGVRWPARN